MSICKMNQQIGDGKLMSNFVRFFITSRDYLWFNLCDHIGFWITTASWKAYIAGTDICNQDILSIISLMPFKQDTFPSITEFSPYNLHASVHWYVGFGIICCFFPQRQNEVKFFWGDFFFPAKIIPIKNNWISENY